MTPTESKEDWADYRRLLLAEIKRLNEHQEKVETEIQKLKVQLAVLQVRAGLTGLVGGALAAGITIAAKLVD